MSVAGDPIQPDIPTEIRVLHVDDDPGLADLTARFLQRSDDRFDVVTAGSADEGLAVLDDERIDCVVSDYEMPGMDGIAFLKTVREERPDLPFVLFTGKGSEEVASDAISAGVTDYLQKETGTEQYAVLANRVGNAVEKRRTERRLHESERRFRELAELSPDGLFRTDTAGRFTYASPAAGELLGVDTAALVETEFREYLAEGDHETAEAGFARVLDGEVVRGLELTLTTAEGERRLVEVSASPVHEDEAVVAVQGLVRDVTDRERLEREHRIEHYRTMVENYPDGGVFLFDADLRCVLAGGTELAAVGLTPATVHGTTPSELYPPDIAAELEAAFRAALDGEARSFEQTYQGAHYSIDTRPLPDVPGLCLAVSRNVTESRERERKLYALRERSRDLMHTRTKSETARVAVDAADEVLGARLSGANLLNEEGTVLESVAVMDSVQELFEEPPSYARDAPQGSRDAVVWEVFESGTPRRIDDVGSMADLDEETPAGSVVIHPVGDHGVFIVSAPESDAWNDSDVALAEILATTLTAAMDRVEREQRLRDREHRLGRLHEATRDLVAAEGREEIASGVVSAAQDILDFSIVQVRYHDGAADGLVPVAASDEVASLLGERTTFTPEGESLNWAAYEAGEVRRYDDIADRDDAVDARTALRSLMILPLGRYGTLSVGETTPDAFDESDDFLARILATAAETALAAAEREAELRSQHTELQRKNDRLEEFASILSHDLRNPLMVAHGNLELAAEGDTDAVTAAEDALDRMDEMITDLLALARNGEGLADLAPVDLATASRDAWGYVDTGDATLRVETDLTLRADRDRLQQLLENLLRNAVEHGSTSPRSHAPEDAAGASSGEPSVADAPEDAVEHGSTSPDSQAPEDAAPAVTVTVGDLPDGFYVDDDGPGIPEDLRETVLESGYTTSESGTGIGLGIVGEIATAHGWTLDLAESPSGGARFAFTDVDVA